MQLEHAKPHMQALAKACDALGIAYVPADEYGDFLVVTIGVKEYFFTNTRTPFNNESVASVCLNKVYSYMLLKDELAMPKTKSYIDPLAAESLQKYVTHTSVREIVADIVSSFTFPVVLKMNAGSQGRHVYKADTARKLTSSIKAIFNQRQRNYDFSVLVQPYIEIVHEYRVLVLDGEIVLLYEKVVTEKNDNLSPLHNESGKAVIIEDATVYEKIRSIIADSPRLQAMRWLGLDIAQDATGDWWIIELNSHPGFSYFIRDNGIESLVPVYTAMLQKLQNESNEQCTSK